MTLDQLKNKAEEDMSNNKGYWGAADGVLEGKSVTVVATHVGCNKPGRKEYVRFKVVEG